MSLIISSSEQVAIAKVDLSFAEIDIV